MKLLIARATIHVLHLQEYQLFEIKTMYALSHIVYADLLTFANLRFKVPILGMPFMMQPENDV